MCQVNLYAAYRPLQHLARAENAIARSTYLALGLPTSPTDRSFVDPRIRGALVRDLAGPQPGLFPADRPSLRHVASRDRQPCLRFHETERQCAIRWRRECDPAKQVNVALLESPNIP